MGIVDVRVAMRLFISCQHERLRTGDRVTALDVSELERTYKIVKVIEWEGINLVTWTRLLNSANCKINSLVSLRF